jgi:hypothetical protein
MLNDLIRQRNVAPARKIRSLAAKLDPPDDDRLKGTSATDEPEETSTAT